MRIQIYLIISFLFFFNNCFSTDAEKYPVIDLYKNIVVNPDSNAYVFFEDITGNLTIEEIQKLQYDTLFQSKSLESNNNLDSYFWIRFRMKGSSIVPFVMDLNYLYNKVEFYVPVEGQTYIKYEGGLSVPYFNKQIETAHDVFYFVPNSNASVYYLKVKRVIKKGIYPVFEPFNIFTERELTETNINGFLLGIVFIVAFYTITLFLRLNIYSYLYFSFFVLSFGIYQMIEINMFSKYLWFVELNMERIFLMHHIPSSLLIISLLLFCREILILKDINKTLDQILLGLIAIRTAILFISIIIGNFFISLQMDIVILFIPLIIGFYAWRIPKSVAPYFSVAYLFILAAFIFKYYAANANNHTYWGYDYTVYFLLLNVAGIAFFSLTIAQMMKLLQNEIDDAQAERLQQMMEKERIRDTINKELEFRIDERTREIHERNTQLDTLVYKTSHDIRGPLKSIIGISDIAMIENNSENFVLYFEHVKKSAVKLDNYVTDLLNVVKANHLQSNKNRIDFSVIIHDVMESLAYMPGFNTVKIQHNIQEGIEFYSDYKILYSVFQNLIENAINYRDPAKEHPLIFIKAAFNGGILKIEISDNGIGIPENKQDNIFDMFFQANPMGMGSGLGLHIIKISIHNLGGEIQMMSTEGAGTTFIITFKNLESKA